MALDNHTIIDSQLETQQFIKFTQTTLKPPNRMRTGSRRLAEIYRHQAVHAKTRTKSII